MYRDGTAFTVIPTSVVERASADPKGLNVAIRFDDTRGICLHLLDNEAAQNVAGQKENL
jgi:hypothetical protein